MAKGKLAINKVLLPVLLVIVPIIIMWAMGFGNYNANEFNILGAALLGDVALYIGYKLLFKIRRNP